MGLFAKRRREGLVHRTSLNVLKPFPLTTARFRRCQAKQNIIRGKRIFAAERIAFPSLLPPGPGAGFAEHRGLEFVPATSSHSYV